MRKPFIRFTIFFLIITLQNVFGQSLKFETLEYKNVFEQSPVVSITQDLQGRLWFGENKNLFKYDSYRIVNLFDEDSLVRKEIKYVSQLAVNGLNDLFIASSDGIYIYDITKKNLKTVGSKVLKFDFYADHMLAHGNHVFICSDKGLFVAMPNGDNYILKTILKRPNIFAINHLKEEKFIVASEKGIELLSWDETQPVKFEDLKIPFTFVGKDNVITLCTDQKDIWVGTKKNGIFRYNFLDDNWLNYKTSNSNLLNNEIWKIIKDREGKIWIATQNGLSIYNGNNSFVNYQSNPLLVSSLNANSICDLYLDKQNIMWIGTFHGGMNYLIPDQLEPIIYSTSSVLDRRLSTNIINSIEMVNGDYWIGTEKYGINILDGKSNSIKRDKSLSTLLHIKSLYYHKDKVYIGTGEAGYSIYDLKSKTVTNFMLHNSPVSYMNIVHDIMVSANGSIYLGTKADPYVISNNKGPQLISEIKKSPWVDFEQDSKGRIYAKRLYERLYVKKSENKPFEPLFGPVSDYFIDKENLVWLTSEKKVVKISPNGLIVTIAEFEGIKLNGIVVVKNDLWITCDKGLLVYNIATKQMRILNKYDGIPLNNLSNSLIKVLSDKSILVTSLAGLIQIDPSQLSNNLTASLYLEDIIVNENRSVLTQLIQKDTTNNYSLDLKYNENLITLSFGSNNLIKPAKNKYKYILKGVDPEWRVDDKPDFRYSNLSPGKYEFEIYICNNDGIWSTVPLNISIKISPPVWRSWWAYLLYLSLLTVVLHQLYKFRVERKLASNLERVQKNKIKFFTHISHEIRTPLTLINAPLDDIIEDSIENEVLHRKLKRIKKNTNKLLNIVNELLDFKKFDENKYPLKKSIVSFKEFLEDNFYLFSDLAKLKNINYYIRRIDDVGQIAIDVNQFEKVIFNLLSNAIKYTPLNGTIYLELLDDDENLQIRIVDNGIGIKPEYEFLIFDEYFQVNPGGGEIGIGIGLALSNEIVKKHGGKLEYQPILEDGESKTLFSITIEKDLKEYELYLPVSPAPNKSDALAKNIPYTSKSKTTILIIEDNVEIQEFLIDLLKDDYYVFTANDGEEGYKISTQHLPDLIVSDIMMPKMNGIELCERIKSEAATSHIPIILLTAVMDPQQLLEGMKYGANIYLTKPIDKILLKLTINNLLQISDKRRREFDIEKSEIDNEIDHKFFNSLNSLIEENLSNEEFEVNYISMQMGMSVSTLYRKLKAVTDLTVNNYVKIYRLNKAKSLLDSKLNISEVAYMVGFSDRKYFSREFKKHFGSNPSDYLPKKNNK